MMMHRTATSIAALLVLTAACGGSDGATADTDPPTPATSEKPTTDPVTTDPATTDPVVTDADHAPGTLVDPSTLDVVSVVDQLARLPLAPANAALAEDGKVSIEATDFVAAAAMLGLEPASVDTGGLDTLLEVTDASPVDSGGTGFGTVGLVWPDFVSEVQVSNDEPEFGFSLLDVEAFATIVSFPSQITVVSGDLALPADVLDLGNGVLGVGEGDDFAIGGANRTPARPLGRPHRVGVSDDLLAISLSTPTIEAWLDGGPTLATDPTVLAAAESLDRAHVVSSLILWGDLAASADFEVIDPDDLLQVPFRAVGIGATAIDGSPATAVSYVYDDEATAESALAEIEALWRDGTLYLRPVPVSEMFDVVGVERVANTVIVTALVDDETTTHSAFQLLYAGEPMFSHA